MKNARFQKLASQIARLEGKKKQVSIGNIREVLSCLIKLEAKYYTRVNYSMPSPLDVLSRLADKENKKGYK